MSKILLIIICKVQQETSFFTIATTISNLKLLYQSNHSMDLVTKNSNPIHSNISILTQHMLQIISLKVYKKIIILQFVLLIEHNSSIILQTEQQIIFYKQIKLSKI